MNRSQSSILASVLLNSFLRTIYGYLLFVVVLIAFPYLPVLRDYAGNWYWFLIAALVLHGLYFVNTLNDTPRLRKIISPPKSVPQEDVRLDTTRRPYLDDVLARKEIINRRIEQLTEIPALKADMAGMVSELGRLIPELETLLKRNQRLGADIQRFESARATARPSAASMQELRELYNRQWEVIKRVTGEVATFDANLAIVINQFDAERDSEQLDSQIKEWSANLGAWKDSIRQVYAEGPVSSYQWPEARGEGAEKRNT